MKFRIHTTERKFIVVAESASAARRRAIEMLNPGELITKIKVAK